MTLKFEELLPEVQKMGRMIAHQTESISERGQRALQLLRVSDDLAEIHRMIDVVRDKDAGYRGAAPHTEAIHLGYEVPELPAQATIVAVDGSQVYPDFHMAALYYLTNIGTFTFFHGEHHLPTEESQPFLFYTDAEIRERHGHGSLIRNSVVNFRRDVQEIDALTTSSARHWETEAPLIGLRDGRLLWWLGSEIPNAAELETNYHAALVDFHKIHQEKLQHNGNNASIVGYVDSEDSRFVVRLLHLLTLEDDEITRAELEMAGPFEGLTDGWLFRHFLMPGERSAVMIQQSPQNKRFKEVIGDAYEVCFFYVNVGSKTKPHIIRLEIPMWVANQPSAIDEVHSLVLNQCTIAGNYPYALTRADELATITGHERRQLDNLINIELLKNRQDVDKSPKQISKDHARAPRRSYGQPLIRKR